MNRFLCKSCRTLKRDRDYYHEASGRRRSSCKACENRRRTETNRIRRGLPAVPSSRELQQATFRSSPPVVDQVALRFALLPRPPIFVGDA
jgi:hypothetical protein